MAVTTTWTGGSSGYFNVASNWSGGTVPSYQDVYIPAGSTVILGNNVALSGNLYITGSGTVTLSGAYTVAVSNGVYMNAGETLGLSGTTLTSSSLNLSGTGTFTVSGGTFRDSNGLTVATGQNLVLANTTYSTSSGATGGGTVTLNGSTVTFTGAAPTATFSFAAVASGGTNNVLNVPSYTTSLVVTNMSYGDEISVGGAALKLVSTGRTSGGLTVYDLESTSGSVYGTVTLASGTPGATAEPSGYTIPLINVSGTEYIYPCFYAGTLLATADGEIAVEAITPGMAMKTATGEVLPVRWVGRREVSTRFADPLKVLPIRIKAGALAEGLPVRDLLVSPDHAMFLDGVLVQAGALVNGTSILREENVPECFTYYHVELATHELLLAEGAATESFVDNMDRMNFHNWDSRVALHAPIVEMEYPRAKSHRQVPEVLRRVLAARAALFAVAAAA